MSAERAIEIALEGCSRVTGSDGLGHAVAAEGTSVPLQSLT